jgi:uncharacterized protein
MAEIYYLVIIIAVFSVVQSIFGVGLLLFGTPTLLLLEYSYSETLWLLLPCSVTISLIQVVNDYKLIEAKKGCLSSNTDSGIKSSTCSYLCKRYKYY